MNEPARDPARFVMFCPLCNDALYPYREQKHMTFRSASRRLLMAVAPWLSGE